VRLLSPRPTHAAAELFACACAEAAKLSLAVGAEHLLLAAVLHGATAGVEADELRELIANDERDALASLGISLESVRGELEERLGDGAWRHACMPISPEAKRVLALAARRRRRVTAEQLLDALVQHSPTARRLLGELGR
jgi:hypothetical protein